MYRKYSIVILLLYLGISAGMMLGSGTADAASLDPEQAHAGMNSPLADTEKSSTAVGEVSGAIPKPDHCVAAEKKSGINLVLVPGGEFPLGAGRRQHTARLSPFWIGKYPVTNAEYGRFLEANTDAAEPKFWTDDRFNGPLQPVVGVSWDEARSFVAWAGLQLPTEAQWEAAARGQDGRLYPWGDADPTPKLANYLASGTGQTSPVGKYPKGEGPYGTLDQAGNVSEWCEDAWVASAYADRDGKLDPSVQSEDPKALRVVRGGSWALSAQRLATAFRDRSGPDFQLSSIGFRVVCRAASGP